MRYRWLLVVVVIGLLGATPAAARIVVVEPNDEIDLGMDPAEVKKLATLQSTTFPSIVSEVSPDDTTILSSFLRTNAPDTVEFVNVNDGSTRRVSEDVLDLEPLSEVVWRDNRTAVYLSTNTRLGTVLVELDRETGAVKTREVDIPGFILSLAPDARRVLIVRLAVEEMSNGVARRSPFDTVVKQVPGQPTGPIRFDAQGEVLRVASEGVQLSILDLNSGEIMPIVRYPEGTALISEPAWSPDGSRLALVHTVFSGADRRGLHLAELAIQDALGNLPPARNPFLQGNAVDVFDLAHRDLRPSALKAADGDGHIFHRVAWSTDGQTLLAQVRRPAQIKGRRYPVYQYPDRSTVRFYDANVRQIGAFDRPEIEAPTRTTAQWLSPDEVVFNAPYGLSYRMYYYNRVSGEFRQVSIWEGSSYRVRSTHRSRQLIFNFGSFDHPDELYRIGWDGKALFGLTHLNNEIAALNHIRADQVTFTVRSGARRTGYLLQPADAPFPPRNARIVVWQGGGPGDTVTNEWRTEVETPFNLLPNFGIGLLILPLAGREGYGPQFYNALADGDNFGELDVDEAAQAVQQMIARGWTSRSRVGITGCSFGGYFASQSITRYPALYGAANAQCSLLDLFHEWQFGFTALVSYLEGRPPTTNSLEYSQDSPLYNAAKVRTPLLIFHGERDFLPLRIVENFHDQVEANGTPVALLEFKGEEHGLGLATNQLTAGQAQILWFREYLGGAGQR